MDRASPALSRTVGIITRMYLTTLTTWITISADASGTRE